MAAKQRKDWWVVYPDAVDYVRRECDPDPCEDCGAQDGDVVAADSAAAQSSHIHCRCQFIPCDAAGNDVSAVFARHIEGAALAAAAPDFAAFLDAAAAAGWQPSAADLAGTEPAPAGLFDDETVVFAGTGKRGNIEGFARYWKGQMGGGAGRKGDFDACVATLSGKKGIKDPQALCAWWHKRETGARPGKAAAEMARMDTLLTATFATANAVRRRGKIFEIGEYPAQNYAMTAAEVTDAAARYTGGAPVKIAHTDTVLDGLLGTLAAFGLMEDGRSVWGEVEMTPEASLILPAEVPVSVGWHRETKLPVEISLELDPQVKDAAIAAFAKRHDTVTGRMHVQSLHDRAVSGGAQCKANFASGHEKSFIQEVHDGAITHGATCEGEPGKGGYPMFTARTAPQRQERGKMEFFKEFFRGKAAADLTPEQRRELVAEFQKIDDPAPPAAEPPERAENRQLKTTIFVDAQVATFKIVPALKDDLTALFAAALEVDALDDVAKFRAGKPSVADLLTAFFAKAPAHTLTSEAIDPNLNPANKRQIAAMNKQNTNEALVPGVPGRVEAEMSEERRLELLRATPAGQAILSVTRGK